jgi:hypothetical protein
MPEGGRVIMTKAEVWTGVMRAACVAAGLCVPMVASASARADRYTPDRPYQAVNLFKVAPIAAPDAVLEVYASPGASGKKYFCAAGEFALRFLGSAPGDRLVITRAEAPSDTRPGFKSVLFEIVPRAAATTLAPSGPFIDPDRLGENRSVNAANSFCVPPNRRRRDD